MNSLDVSIKKLTHFGNAELTYGDNYIFVNAGKDSGVCTEYFKSTEDAVCIKFRGRTVDASPLGYRLCSYDEEGLETFIFGEEPELDCDGCFDMAYTFDPINLAVYKNAVKFRFFIYSSGEKADIYINRFSIEEGNDVYAEEEEDELEINNLTADGVYVLQKDGGKITVPIVPKKVVFVGNSILLGMGTYGMCATSDKADYALHVQQKILEHNPECTFNKVHGSGFENSLTFDEAVNWFNITPNTYTAKPARESFSEDTDLVIIQLTDNVNTDVKISVFEKSADMLIDSIKDICPKARIIWVYGWYNKYNTRDKLYELCSKWSIELIDISGCRSKENEAKSGQISIDKYGNEFVVKDAWVTHPGDKGMKAIAGKIIEKLGI